MSFVLRADYDQPRPRGDLAITALGALAWLFLVIMSAAALASPFVGWWGSPGFSFLRRVLGFIR